MGAWSVRTRFASCSPISESFSVSLEARAHDAFNGFRAATYWDDSMRAALRMSVLRRSATAAATALCCAVRRSATTCFRGSHEPTRRGVCEVNDDWVIPDMAGIGAGYTCTGPGAGAGAGAGTLIYITLGASKRKRKVPGW